MPPNWKNRTLWTGDNLDIMRGMNSASVDLIYLDPPFNSNANYAAPIGSQAAGAEFKDTWGLNDISLAWHGIIKHENPTLYSLLSAVREGHSDSMMAYLIYMVIRIIEMRRILKATGSIYLHCDSTASHYLKLLMDCIFGSNKFQGEITWQRTSAHNDKVFGRITDSILFYGASPKDVPANRLPLNSEYVKKYYRHKDKRGVYRTGDLTGAETSSGESGRPWKGYNPSNYGGRHWSVPKSGEYAKYIDKVLAPGYLAIRGVHDRLDFLDKHDLIHHPGKDGFPNLKRYLAPDQGQKPPNLWTDIPPLSASSKENTHYPTQKPLKLVERIVMASSNSGDIVFDPFCGCATACIAAENKQREWIGIDISSKAADLVDDRLKNELGLFYQCIRRTDIPKRTDIEIPKKYNSPENKKLLYGEQGGYCNGCGQHFQMQNLETDHIIPRSKGGTDHISNLQLLCGSCNRLKGVKSQEYLLKCLTDKGWIKQREARG